MKRAIVPPLLSQIVAKKWQLFSPMFACFYPPKDVRKGRDINELFDPLARRWAQPGPDDWVATIRRAEPCETQRRGRGRVHLLDLARDLQRVFHTHLTVAWVLGLSADMNSISEQRGGQLALKTGPLRLAWWQWGVLGVLLVWLYHAILARLVEQWWNDPDFSHGFFVPLFSALVVWQRRQRLAEVRVKPSWLGLLVLAGSLLVLLVGVLGAELFLSRTSLIFLLAGLIICFLGWNWFRALLFPWAFLFLMVPIPKIVYNEITLPLQFLASQLASSMLGGLGVPVLRQGNIIHLPAIDLEVAEACSGIRSLVSLITLAVIYGHFFESKAWRRVLLAVAAVPIAVLANGIRVMGTGLVSQYFGPDKAQGFLHVFQGWVVFLVSVGFFFLFHRGMRWWLDWRKAALQ